MKSSLYFFCLSAVLYLVACDDDNETATATSYIRVMDIQHGKNYTSDDTYVSAFACDGHFYNNQTLDSVRTPQYRFENFGDFILGRSAVEVRNGERLTLFRGGIDYYNLWGATGAYYEDRDFYFKSGVEPGHGIYFPNLTHRVSVAPVRGGIDYYKWASVPSGVHEISFSKIRAYKPTGSAFYKMALTNEKFVSQQQYFKTNGIYTVVMSNTDVNATDFRIFTLEEDPTFTFNPQKAYVRFVNAIELSSDVADAQTEYVDVYVKETNNADLNQYASQGLYAVPSSEEKLVQAGLKRFSPRTDLAYYEMDFSTFFEKGDTSYIQKREASAFIFFVYPEGQSERTGASPLASYTQILSNAKNIQLMPAENIIAPLAPNGKGYVPTIITIFIGADKLYYNLEQEGVRQRYIDSKP